MEENDKLLSGKKSGEQMLTVVMGVLTFLATVVAAIPAFLQLSQDRPSVYYQLEDVSILTNSDNNTERVKKILRENNIPDSRTTLKVINSGDGAAKQVKLQVTVNGAIIESVIDPNIDSNPIWIDMPKDLNKQLDGFKGKSSATLEFVNMAATKLLTISVGYSSAANPPGIAKSEVFFDNKPAIPIKDISAAPQYSLWQAFKMPLLVLIIGLALTVMISVGILLAHNEMLNVSFKNILRDVISQSLGMAFPQIGSMSRVIFSAVHHNKKKEK